MKKLLLVIAAVFSINANAAIITVTTDKSQYELNEIITATVTVSDLIDGVGVQTLLSGFDLSLTSLLDNSEYVANSVTFGANIVDVSDALAFESVLGLGSFVGVVQIASFFTDTFALQAGLNAFELFSVEFEALAVGSDTLVIGPNASPDLLSDFFGDGVTAVTVDADYTVVAATVSEPATFGAVLLILTLLMAFRREQR
ncbi:hypothetical protein [Alteromonas sp. KUL49]|uniref:hypothetical protein n=1 Tax=Alteromonas sp. KUL49 TaxID=2480798 RepID=UPI00102F2B37|nr:hypothetical protein [Alteromonas sp. KUL49]TAP37406.1 hypothetical protein EYS00_16870 [Alteromonas sp. KUL49]GEA13046.1 hypothetical protein KUL49_34210 [Alteromonas sp. KUL49]